MQPLRTRDEEYCLLLACVALLIKLGAYGRFKKPNHEKKAKTGEPKMCTYFLLQCDFDLLNLVAEKLDLQVYNKKKAYLMRFDRKIAN